MLRVSRSGFYAWSTRPPSRRDTDDRSLTRLIREIHEGSRGTYGAPRIWVELRLDHGVRVSRKRVARLMRAARLQGVHVRRRYARPGWPEAWPRRPISSIGASPRRAAQDRHYLKRYHDVQISPSEIWRILKRLDMSRLPASQRYRRHVDRWKRYEKPLSGHRVQIDMRFIAPLPGSRKKRYRHRDR